MPATLLLPSLREVSVPPSAPSKSLSPMTMTGFDVVEADAVVVGVVLAIEVGRIVAVVAAVRVVVLVVLEAVLEVAAVELE